MNYKLLGVFIGFLLLAGSKSNAKEIKYKFSDIPKDLKENARSIIRNNEMLFEVKSLNKATLNVTFAITILNINGLEDGYFHEFYNKFRKISGIRGRVFDENGEQLKRIPSDDILDYSAISGYSTYEDNRVKFIDPKVRNFPFTIEYSYEENFNGLFSFPPWIPQPSYNLAVERSSYKAVIPKNMSFRYLERNNLPKVTITTDGENQIYSWEAHNLKALEWEPYSISDQERFPCLLAAPSDFEIDDYSGNINSWENFGKFISTLNAGKNILDSETKLKLNELVRGISDDHQKIRKIYEYMQGRTRYVSVQVGIGSWQPFEAALVHRLSYGDCKALANYTKTLLEAVGVKAKYCLVNAGMNAPLLITEFPSSQFNHAFLCVPLKKDTIWLECTSQRVPCGFIGNFTDDRDVLLIDNERSKIVHSRAYTLADNSEIQTSHVKIDGEGLGSVEIHTVYRGLRYENILPVFLADDADKKRRISERMKFANFQLLSFNYKEIQGVVPAIEETLQVGFENYLTPMGTKFLMRLNFSNRIENAPYDLRQRKTDVYIRRPSSDCDTIVYELSSKLSVESMPKPVSIKTRFGEYQSKVEIIHNQLFYTRSFILFKGQYPPTEYPLFVEFFDKVAKADDLKCTLIRNLN